jgi:hypothetical protein
MKATTIAGFRHSVDLHLPLARIIADRQIKKRFKTLLISNIYIPLQPQSGKVR